LERAILYVDGFNFYYGVTKHWWGKNKDLAGLGWCDFHALIERHFHLGDAQLEIKYFTAPVHFENNEEHKRYAVWARAVRTIAGIRVMEGFYKPKSRPDPATKSREEKQSDVNLAVEVMLDALGPRRRGRYIFSATTETSCPSYSPFGSGSRPLLSFLFCSPREPIRETGRRAIGEPRRS